MSNHTPGPWRANTSNDDNLVYDPVTQSGIAYTWTNGDEPYIQNNAERLANARLIAAAPDMLIALQSLATDPPPDLDEPDLDWQVIEKMRAIARAAIAKATGAAP